MRKDWILSCLLSVTVVGCAGTGMTGSNGPMANQPSQVEQLAAMQNAGMPQPSWTQKFTSVFTGNPAQQQIGPSVPKKNPDLDPISLGYASGPPNAELYLSMAKISDHGGNADQARSMYQRALTMKPDHLEGMLALARLEDREGRLDAAIHYYKQAVQMHPQSGKALNDLALCFARQEKLAEAVPPLEQAIRLQPGKQLYRNNLAKVLIELNQMDGAVQHLTSVHPPAVAYYNMGVLLHQRGRNQEAVKFLTASTQADPSLVPAQTLLTQLSSAGQQVAQSVAPTNNRVVPTQQISAVQSPVTPMATQVTPTYQTVPAETAQVPVDRSPVLLPPVR